MQQVYDGAGSRQVLAAMATDDVVAVRIAAVWREPGLFDSRWCNVVGGWIVDHARRYGKAPSGALRQMFDEWAAADGRDEQEVAAMERWLAYVEEEWSSQKPPCADYIIDRAGMIFNRARLRRALRQADEELDRGRIESAWAVVSEASRVDLGRGALVKPAEDFDAWAAALDPRRTTPLIRYPGALGNFFGARLGRDNFIAFMAPDKTCKSITLLDLAFRAVREQRRVALFDVGDMSQDQVLRRLGQRACRRPLRAGRSRVPVSIDPDGNVTWRSVLWEHDLTPSDCLTAFRRVCRDRDLLRLVCYPNSSVNVAGLAGVLREWARENWVADVVVIDYADILAPPAGVKDSLEQIDVTWRQLRRLSQEMRCLVVTVTQSSAAAYHGKHRLLGRQHFSGRKTKLAHVTGMVGLNQTPEEAEREVMRWSWVVGREGSARDHDVVTVVGFLDAMCPVWLVAKKSSDTVSEG